MNTLNRKRLIHRQRGANLMEYALVVSLIMLAGYPAFINIGSKTGSNLCKVSVGMTTGNGNGAFDTRSIYLDPTLGPNQDPCVRPNAFNPCFNGRSVFYDFRTGTVSCLLGPGGANKSNGAPSIGTSSTDTETDSM